VDLDGDDQLTEREVRAFITGRRVRGNRRAGDGAGGAVGGAGGGGGGGAGGGAAGGVTARMDFTAFDMTGGAVYGRGEDVAGPFVLTGTYSEGGRVSMLQHYRPVGGGGVAAPPVRYAGTLRREEGGEVVILGTWAAAEDDLEGFAEGGGGAAAAAAVGGGEFTLRVAAAGSGRHRLGSTAQDLSP
jgi:hypothetical protein